MSPTAAKRVVPKVEPQIVATVTSNGEVKPIAAAAGKPRRKATAGADTNAGDEAGQAKAEVATPSKASRKTKTSAKKPAAAPAQEDDLGTSAIGDELLAEVDGEADAGFDETDSLPLDASDKLEKDDKKDDKKSSKSKEKDKKSDKGGTPKKSDKGGASDKKSTKSKKGDAAD